MIGTKMKTSGLIFLFLFMISCNFRTNEKESQISEFFSYHKCKQHLDDKVYLFMQLEGCVSCVESLVLFAKKQINEPKIKIIVSTIENDPKNYFTDEELKRIIIDKGVKSSKVGLLSGVGTVYLIDKKEIIEIVEINPYNNNKTQQRILEYLKKSD